jgi:hypothetical protein
VAQGVLDDFLDSLWPAWSLRRLGFHVVLPSLVAGGLSLTQQTPSISGQFLDMKRTSISKQKMR